VTFYDKHKTGDILSRMGSDVTIIQDGLSSNISMFIRALSFIIVTLVILFARSPQLTLVTLAGICPVVLSAGCFGAYYKKISRETQTALAELGQVSEEAIGNVRTVKAFANEAEEVAKFRKANLVAYRLGVKGGVAAGAFSFGVSFGMNGCLAGVMYYGAQLC
jgi:ATP-binding cassette, subfamily B (MDR/TAP), member 9